MWLFLRIKSCVLHAGNTGEGPKNNHLLLSFHVELHFEPRCSNWNTRQPPTPLSFHSSFIIHFLLFPSLIFLSSLCPFLWLPSSLRISLWNTCPRKKRLPSCLLSLLNFSSFSQQQLSQMPPTGGNWESLKIVKWFSQPALVEICNYIKVYPFNLSCRTWWEDGSEVLRSWTQLCFGPRHFSLRNIQTFFKNEGTAK